ncbi:MAG: protein jag [Peptococcaceae bacterium]|jgi:spoIIIJ-associated protein|nr:protein jag [Peptococcaceae bacterium]
MKETVTTGKTVDEAVAAAIGQLGVAKERVKVEIVEEPGKKGLFGLLGTKAAKVKVTYEDDPGVLAVQFIQSVCQAMQVDAQCERHDREGQIGIDISGSELGILIGRRGDTLEALQFLTNLAVSKHLNEKVRIIVDVEGYRQRREDTLLQLARRLSEKVQRTGNRVVLEPMNSHERRIIHTALQDETGVTTFSEGEEPNRRIVISLNRNKGIS